MFSRVNVLLTKRPNDELWKRNSSSGGGTLSAEQKNVTWKVSVTAPLLASDVSRVPSGLSVNQI